MMFSTLLLLLAFPPVFGSPTYEIHAEGQHYFYDGYRPEEGCEYRYDVGPSYEDCEAECNAKGDGCWGFSMHNAWCECLITRDPSTVDGVDLRDNDGRKIVFYKKIADSQNPNPESKGCQYSDSDACLQSAWGRYAWAQYGRRYDCAAAAPFCETWAKDVQRCCPETCGTGHLSEAECRILSTSGTCTYPNEAQPLCDSVSSTKFTESPTTSNSPTSTSPVSNPNTESPITPTEPTTTSPGDCAVLFATDEVCGNSLFLGNIKPDVYACAATAARTPGCWNGGAIVSFSAEHGDTGCWCSTDDCSSSRGGLMDSFTYDFSDCAASRRLLRRKL